MGIDGVVLIVGVKSAVGYRDGLIGKTVVIESEKPIDVENGPSTVGIGFVFRVYVYGDSRKQ